MSQQSLAIIGGGFSGATLATQLLSKGAGAPRIFLIDRTGKFGPGQSYSTSHPAHVLNVRAAKLSAAPDRPDDFTDWLRFCARGEAPGASFAPRETYGAYLEAHVRRAARAAEAGALTLVRDDAIACRPEGAGVAITLRSGEVLHADAAVLALGNQPPAPPPPLDDDANTWLHDPWRTGALTRIHSTDDVLLFGTGLTMVDVVLSLASGPRSGAIFALSRRGLTPGAHAVARQASPDLSPLNLPASLSAALAHLRRELRDAAARGAPWQDVLDRLRPETSAWWQDLSVEAQQRFLRHLRPWWDAHRHRTAPHIATWINALRTAGTLRIIAGRLLSADAVAGGVRITYQPRGTHARVTLEAAHAVNCTGPCADITRASDPLLRQLLDDGLVRAHATGLGFAAENDGRVIDENGAAHRNLFALGPLTQGVFWEATAVPEIRARATKMAERFVSRSARLNLPSRHAASTISAPSAP
ncbi:MAG: FAD/NAD(P)-binding protein [Terricaulis sp.]